MEADLSAGVVHDSWGGGISLDRADVDDGAALAHVLHSSLSHREVVQNVAVEGELQPLPRDVLKALYGLALEAGVVDQDVDSAPLVHCLLHNAPVNAARAA